jgi:hypothetical protein
MCAFVARRQTSFHCPCGTSSESSRVANDGQRCSSRLESDEKRRTRSSSCLFSIAGQEQRRSSARLAFHELHVQTIRWTNSQTEIKDFNVDQLTYAGENDRLCRKNSFLHNETSFIGYRCSSPLLLLLLLLSFFFFLCVYTSRTKDGA